MTDTDTAGASSTRVDTIQRLRNLAVHVSNAQNALLTATIQLSHARQDYDACAALLSSEDVQRVEEWWVTL